jgi:geranylgeranyl pyrophosphate synthase
MSRLSKAQSIAQNFENFAQTETEKWCWPHRLKDASSYVFLGGGKRIRPVLAMTCARLFGCESDALSWSLAVELIHTYSLVHDDLPAMDDDDERRGKPTCHIKYDVATAVLVGDALLTRAFEVLSEHNENPALNLKLVALLASASGGGGMVGGQMEDLAGDLSNLDALIGMQNKKTGALLVAAAVGGGLSAGADDESLIHLRAFAQYFGLLFQLTDDMIDKVQDEARDSNNFHHHLSDEGVSAWRDKLILQANASLDAIDRDTSELAELIELIGIRSV